MANKNSKQLERHFKGIANHRRIDIIQLIGKEEGITLDGIAETLDCHVTTVSEHTRKLVQAGLVDKKYLGRTVGHFLSPYGKNMLKVLKSF